MTGYHGSRVQGLDHVQCAQPLAPGLCIALREIEVRVVIDSIPRHNQADRRNMQSSGMCRVGMTKFYYLQLFSLKIEGVAFEDLWRYQMRRNLAWEPRLPEGFDEVRTYLLLHACHRGYCGKRSGTREPVQQELQTQEMVTVSMSNVDAWNSGSEFATTDMPTSAWNFRNWHRAPAVLGFYSLVQAAFEGMILQLLPLRLANEEWLPKAIITK